MSFPAVIAVSCASTLSRSSLNMMDRVLFGKHKMKFFRLYFFTNAFPLFLGFVILAFLGLNATFWSHFWTLPCFLLAITTHLVGLSFSYAFRHYEVRHVIIRAKIPELLLPLFIFIPFFEGERSSFSLEWKVYIPLIITWVGIIPLILQKRTQTSFFDRVSILVISSLLVQMICSSYISIPTKTINEVLSLSVAILLWRCFLTLPFFYWQKKEDDLVQDTFNVKLIGLLFFRAIMALVTQTTFIWCVMEGPPLLIWPILNMTPLISSLASQLVLKEAPHSPELIALTSFFLGSTLPIFL